jgi:tripartite-type tricarboxylate transporter receptor subunit TctC
MGSVSETVLGTILRECGARKGTTMMLRRTLLAAPALLALPARAQAWPDRPVRFIVPFPPGGAADIVGRLLAAHLQVTLGKPFVVENRPGAGSSIGVDALAKAAPDGHTIGMGNIAANAILPAVRRGNVPYRPVDDFAPVTNLVVTPCYLAVNPAKVDVKTVAELVAYAKANPEKLNFGSSGTGTSLHLAMELFMQAAGIRMTHVPFNGGGPSLQALLAGTVDLMVDTVATSWPMVREGRLRALATTMPARLAVAPELPALEELYPGTSMAPWHGLLFPAGTPAPIVARASETARGFLAASETREKFAAQSLDAAPSAPEAFQAFMRAEHARFVALVERANIRVE